MKIFLVVTFLLFVTANATYIKVVSTVKSSDRGLEPCLTQCYGTTGENTVWGALYPHFVTTDIDVSSCGFTAGTTPMISMTLIGMYAFTVASVSPWPVSPTFYRAFLVRLKEYDDSIISSYAANKSLGWRIDWVATGYTC